MMTYHARFEAGGSTCALSTPSPITKPFSRISDDVSVVGTIPEPSTAHELRLGYASLERQFPDESFSPASITADPKVTVGLFAFLVVLLGVIAAQTVL
jgi:hypothetical protein